MRHGCLCLLGCLELVEALEAPLGLRVDRDGPATLRPQVDIQVDATLFDGVDLAALSDGEQVEITQTTSQPGQTLLETLLASALLVEL